jgi:hypothetical protein
MLTSKAIFGFTLAFVVIVSCFYMIRGVVGA